jgi:hypothetical protein
MLMRKIILSLAVVGVALAACGPVPHATPYPQRYAPPPAVAKATTSPRKAGFVPPGGFITPTAARGGSGGGGTGTVTSVASASADITVTNGTTTPDLAIEYTTHAQKRITGAGVAHKAVTDVASNGTATVNYFVDACASGTSTTCTVTNNSITTNVAVAPSSATSGQVASGQSADGTVTYGDYTGDPKSYWKIDEEFCNAGTNAQFTYGTAGTGTSHTTTTTVQGNPCIDDMVAGTTATTGRASWQSATSTIQFGSGSGKWKWKARVQIPTLSIGTEQFGFAIGPTSALTTLNPAAGFMFMYDRENVATAPATGAGNTSNKNNWICRSGDASAYTEYVMDGTVVSDASFTTVNKTVTAAQWYDLEIDYDSTLGTPEVDFFVDGTKSCAITTHIPTASGSTHTVGPMAAICLRGGTVSASRDCMVDYVHVYNYGLSR